MKAVLLGLDFLNLDGQLKFLEMNSDTYIPDSSYNSFDFDALEGYLVNNSFTKFRIIYKDVHVCTQFVNRLQQICDAHSIIFEPVIVPFDSVTVPAIEDLETEFTLRLSYDITAIIDDVYCRDKKELLRLIFNGNETELIPKTYFKKDNDTFDNLNNLVDNGIHPNLIIKKSLPDADKNEYPEFYNFDTEEELNSFKDTVFDTNGTLIVQEFQYNANNLYHNKIRDHIRYWIILCADTETTIDFGGYISPNALPLEQQYITYTDNKLDNDSRILYFSNPNRIGKGIPSIYETVKIIDGEEIVIPISDVEIGDTLKATLLPGFSSVETAQGVLNWHYTGSIADIGYTTASVIVKLVETVDEWFIKVNYEIDQSEHSMLVNLVELILACDINGENLTFKQGIELQYGDYIVLSNTNIAKILSINYEKFVGDVVKINIEPDDVFLSGTNLNGINQTIASNFIIYNYKQ